MNKLLKHTTKNKLLFFFAGFSFLMLNDSCTGNLDVEPIDILSEERIFQEESLLTSYMATLYDAIPMDEFGTTTSGSTDESPGGIGDGSQWWGYDHVRRVNNLMEKLPAAGINEEAKLALMGEAKFIRAYYYFSMVKRYGGVPIISEVQNYTPGADITELEVPRNTEKEAYDFIATDLDEAASLLPETNIRGRATKHVALALKSRAMLYAASSAEYFPVQMDGIVGIPASEANNYWQAAFNAAEAVITSGQYSLYKQNPNKEANFQELFLAEDNPEAILIKDFSYPRKTHNYDRNIIPYGVRGPDGYSSGGTPTVRLVEQFERIDGSSGTLNIGTPSDPVYYNHPTDLFSDYDPRLLATVIVPFGDWRGEEIDVQAGLYDQGNKVEAGDYNALYNIETQAIDDNGTLHVVGQSGFGGSEKTNTGFYLRKYLDPSLERSQVRTLGSSQHWIAIRYAEVLLNYAEAAVELGNIQEAKEKINMIRSRAGIVPLEDAEVTVEIVRHERLVELAFESHRWWDYRRWRVADEIFNNMAVRQLRPYYDVQEDAYRFEIDYIPQSYKTFNVRAYYVPIPADELAKNPHLVQNPNY
ncbi:MAG: RagB/SusD family nutrient uptake outer membrane protein [Fulvivirga sp.]